MTRFVRAVALAAGLSFTLLGCTAPALHSRPAPPSAATTAAHAASIQLTAIPSGTVVATGDFGSTGPIRGAISVVKDGDDYRMDLTGFQAPVEVELAVTSTLAATFPGCYDRWRLAFGEPTTWSGAGDVPSKSIGLHIGSLLDPSGTHPDLVDPTFLDTVVVTAAKADGGCVLTSLGSATLTWIEPTLRPDLKVGDGAATPGASGTVTLAADGTPSLYLVHQGDTIVQIAHRFGITAEDLYYLNPISDTSTQNPIVYTGDELNLGVLTRGHPTITGH